MGLDGPAPVSERAVRGWLSRIDKDAKDARDKRIFGMWLACHTQQEIADAEGIPQRTVADLMDGFSEIGNLAASAKSAGYEVDRHNGTSHQHLVAEGRPPLTFAFHPRATLAPGEVREILVKEVGLDQAEALKAVRNG